MNRTLVLYAWFAQMLLVALPAAAIERAEILAAVSSITKEEAQELINTLADDSFEGREAGSRGGRAAGNLLMKEFEKAGLTPAGDGKTYFQGFNGSARNILGLLEGSDPQLKHEVIVLGAHYDHVGYGRSTNSFGPTGYIHNGADDNASGVTGVLEVIEALQHLTSPPRRSILFALWDAEEQGLLGSRHWLSSPTLDKSRVIAAVNLDMIGRLRDSRLEVYGTRTGANWRRIVSQSNRDAGLDIDFTWTLKPDSDHWSFYTQSIPSIMFHTRLHGDYHRPSDDSHTINADGVISVARVALLTLLDLADGESIGTFRETSRSEHAGSRAWLEQPVTEQAPRWGIPFEWKGELKQIVLTGVSPGSPAQRAGLQAGDRILAFKGRAIESEQRFRLELLAASGESVFTVARDGQEKPLEIKVTPAGSPIRVGITWRTDDAEPLSVLLTQVVYGSAADVAGLTIRDRIYRVNGEAFASPEEFTRLITSQPAPLVLEVERQGRIKTVTLDVLDP